MRTRLDAVWKKDAATWSRLTADEFTVVVPEGTLMTKADRLAAMKTEKLQPIHAVEREQIRAYGEALSGGLSMRTNGFLKCGCDRTALGGSSQLK
jgi:hypothetical protein